MEYTPLDNKQLIGLINDYYGHRSLRWPTVEQAMMFAQTEMAEVYELLLERYGGWVRNNPDQKERFTLEKFAEELGDAIMMLLVAGIVVGVDPLQALINKIEHKIANE